MTIFANSEDPDDMQHNAAFHQECCISSGFSLFVKVKKIFRQKKTIV